MATTVKVEFYVTAACEVKEVYIVGSDSKLGSWDESKAVKLEYNENKGAFYAAKMFEAGAEVEFKVLASKTWAEVEKGSYGEEIQNRSFTAAKGLKVIANVAKFA